MDQHPVSAPGTCCSLRTYAVSIRRHWPSMACTAGATATAASATTAQQRLSNACAARLQGLGYPPRANPCIRSISCRPVAMVMKFEHGRLSGRVRGHPAYRSLSIPYRDGSSPDRSKAWSCRRGVCQCPAYSTQQEEVRTTVQVTREPAAIMGRVSRLSARQQQTYSADAPRTFSYRAVPYAGNQAHAGALHRPGPGQSSTGMMAQATADRDGRFVGKRRFLGSPTQQTSPDEAQETKVPATKARQPTDRPGEHGLPSPRCPSGAPRVNHQPPRPSRLISRQANVDVGKTTASLIQALAAFAFLPSNIFRVDRHSL